MRADILMASHTPSAMRLPSVFRIAVFMEGLDSLPSDILTSGSCLQSSRHHRISKGYPWGRVPGWWYGDIEGKASARFGCSREGVCDRESLGASEAARELANLKHIRKFNYANMYTRRRNNIRLTRKTGKGWCTNKICK